MLFPSAGDESAKVLVDFYRSRLFLREKSLQRFVADVRLHLKDRLETIQESIEVSLSWRFSRIYAPIQETNLVVWVRMYPTDRNAARESFHDHSPGSPFLPRFAIPHSDEYIALTQNGLPYTFASRRLIP